MKLRVFVFAIASSLVIAAPAGAATFTSLTAMYASASSGNSNLESPQSPQALNVGGLSGVIVDVNVLLKITNSGNTSYFDWMLMAPDGTAAMVSSDCGWYTSATAYNVFFDQSAANSPSNGVEFATTTGQTSSFKARDCASNPVSNGDDFAGVLPSADLTANLDRFNGRGANGQWRLYFGGSGGPGPSTNMSISGWTLEVITAPAPAPPPAPTPDATAPVLTRPAVSGKTLGYTLSEPATLSILVERSVSGIRNKAKKCVKRKRRAKGKACTRQVALPGALSTLATAGIGTYAWNGRLSGKKLAPGKYRLTMTATDAAGNVSAPATYKVTIKKPKKKKKT